jgi:isoquinoline 1-oxidoreductase beta subunit
MIIDQITSRTDDTPLSRRGFLQTSAALGGGLMLSLSLPMGRGEAATAEEFAPNAFIRIGSDGQVVLTMPYVEMGQGTYTSIPMLIAEELDVSLKQVKLEHAPPNEKLYTNPLLGVQATRMRCAARGSRCARPARRPASCSSRLRPNVGASTQKLTRRTAR